MWQVTELGLLLKQPPMMMMMISGFLCAAYHAACGTISGATALRQPMSPTEQLVCSSLASWEAVDA